GDVEHAADAAAEHDAARVGAARVDGARNPQVAVAAVAGADADVAAERPGPAPAGVDGGFDGHAAPAEQLDLSAGIAAARVERAAAAQGEVEPGLDADVAAAGADVESAVGAAR